ncbi:MAG: 4-(cytidine 5'-diphospho)-2-C-methyl-D-erythritol kinase [Bacteroidetes bacterium]|nr:MAG: 4-(cytidine 5'-diphospho)-2-C-methyl-D-erythritol kinase [Bacteroidota bacterium]
MLFFPNAKINLGLHILRKRADNFHDIESFFYPIDWQDVLEILPKTAGELEFVATGINIPPDGKDNLCVRAYQMLQQDFGLPAVYMHLHKNIPIGAGMGGGSADSAFVLTGLNQLFDLRLTTEQLLAYAGKLGSDCAFFVENKAQLAEGRGEILSPNAPHLSGTYITVVYPNLHITTAEAYRGVVPCLPALPLQEAIALPREQWKDHVQNDFEKSLFPQYPILPAIKQTLYDTGAFYASMTGSGSAVFGLFEAETDITLDNCTVWKGKIC